MDLDFDLDALERLLSEAEPSAPWRETKYGIITDDGTGTCVVSWDYAWGDAEGVAEGTLKPLIVAAVNALRALITRLRAAEARTAWQPMETAPMTMDYILTHGPRGHVVARYCSALGWVDEDDRDVYFSHWQPLPAPSASEVPRD